MRGAPLCEKLCVADNLPLLQLQLPAAVRPPQRHMFLQLFHASRYHTLMHPYLLADVGSAAGPLSLEDGAAPVHTGTVAHAFAAGEHRICPLCRR